MAQHQELKRKRETVQQTAKHGVPPSLSIELLKMSDLPNKTEPWSDVHLPVDILLLTVEDCEFLACHAYLRNSFRSYHVNLGHVYFGNMGESEEEPLKVALIRCSEGSSGPGGALIGVKNAVMQLRPKAIFSVGCCEGLNPEDTKLGDVVISSMLTTADFKTPVGKNIANLIRSAADGWDPPLTNPEAQNVQVHRDSNILSGMNADSAKRRRLSHSTAVAMEHEGQGIFVAAHDLKIEWVIVKGISHFTDDYSAPDKSWKSYACVMAASLVSNMLSDPIVFKHWRNYEDPEQGGASSGASQQADRDQDMQSVQKESSTSKRKENPPCSITQDDKHADPAWLGECQRQLRTIYTAMNKVKIVPWDQSSAVHIDDIYTQLSWLKEDRKPSGVKQEKLEDYTQIFTGGKHVQAPKRILVYGRPGIGKTVFTQKTTFDWSQQRFKEKLGTFEVVLLVKLRDVRNCKDVPDILRASELLSSDGEISVDKLYEFVRNHQEKVLLILDGHDELSPENQLLVREIWKRRQLRDCCIIITTRQMNSDELRGPSDAQFQINGFDTERQKEFARRFLKDKDDVQNFLAYLRQHNLEELAEIPLLLLILCLLWKEKDRGGLPSSRANIFFQFVQTFFDHLTEKNSDAVLTRKVDDYTYELCKLGSLAFDALLQNCLYFPLSKLPDRDLIKKLIDVGLFNILNTSNLSLNRDQGVFFIHKSLQEYLAALFLKEELLSRKNQDTPSLSKVDSMVKIINMNEVFLFACELSGEAASEIIRHLGVVAEKEGWTKYNFMEIRSEEDLSLDQRSFLTLCGRYFSCCPADTRRELFPTFLSSVVRGVLLINASQLHIIASEHLLTTTTELKYVFFTEENSKHLQEESCYSDLITVVEDLDAVVVSCSGEQKASEFIKKHKILRENEFLLKKEEEKTHLYIARIDLRVHTEMLKELLAAPKSITTTNRKHNGVESNKEQNTTGLTKNSDSNYYSNHCLSMVWDIEAYHVDRSELEIVTDLLSFVTAPRVIEVYGKYGVAYDTQLIKSFVNNIKFNNRMETLLLYNINLTANEAEFIAQSLYKAPNLLWLSLSSNPLLGEGVSFLTQHLHSAPHLEYLGLTDVKMTRKQAEDLTTAVHHNKISELESYYHDINGNLIPEDEWRSEGYWDRQQQLWQGDSSSETENEQDQHDSQFPHHASQSGGPSMLPEVARDVPWGTLLPPECVMQQAPRMFLMDHNTRNNNAHDPQLHHHASQSGGPSLSAERGRSARLLPTVVPWWTSPECVMQQAPRMFLMDHNTRNDNVTDVPWWTPPECVMQQAPRMFLMDHNTRNDNVHDPQLHHHASGSGGPSMSAELGRSARPLPTVVPWWTPPEFVMQQAPRMFLMDHNTRNNNVTDVPWGTPPECVMQQAPRMFLMDHNTRNDNVHDPCLHHHASQSGGPSLSAEIARSARPLPHDSQLHRHASQSGGPSMSPDILRSARATSPYLAPLPHDSQLPHHASQSGGPSMSPEVSTSARATPPHLAPLPHDPWLHHHASQSGGPLMSPDILRSARATPPHLPPLPHDPRLYHHASQIGGSSVSPEVARSARAPHSYLEPLPERIDGRGNLEPEHEKSSSK